MRSNRVPARVSDAKQTHHQGDTPHSYNAVDRLQFIVHRTISGLSQQLNHIIPDADYRHFYQWALAHEKDWVRLIGADKTITFVMLLTSHALDEKHWEQFVEYSQPFTHYLTYEVISDNLAFGLAQHAIPDQTTEQRYAILEMFNQALIGQLSGTTEPLADVLSALEDHCKTISSFHYSLNPDAHKAIANNYISQNQRDVTVEQLDFATGSLLAANLLSCLNVAQRVQDFHTKTLIVDGLRQRYEATSQFMTGTPLSIDAMVSLGADAILLKPTLAYYLEAVLKAKGQQDRLSYILQGGLLEEGLRHVSTLVRLLNDFGPALMIDLTETERFAFRRQLQASVTACGYSLADALLQMKQSHPHCLTRLEKDIVHGEINLGLYGLTDLPPSVGVHEFCNRLDYFAALYKARRHRLKTVLVDIDQQLGDKTASQLLWRCVCFHEDLYAYHYSTPEGEYAV